MKSGYRLLLLLVVPFVLHSHAAAADYDVVKIYPKTGQPMVVRNVRLPWSGEVEGIRNNTRIKIPMKKVKSINFLGESDVPHAQLEVELTMRDGKKVTLGIDTGVGPCRGDTEFGQIVITPREMSFLDLYPDLSKPDQPVQAPAAPPARDQGKVIDPDQ